MKQDKKRKHTGWTRLRRPQDDAETTKQYTEEEVQSLSHYQSNHAGIIRPDTGDLHMPSDFVETGDGEQTKAPPRVMLVIITLALIFIAIIAYLVSQMPNKE
ncbi:MAG: hypothetical protein AABO41_27495 [Acidobacteriota bacterium]